MDERHDVDVVVLGSGSGGLSAAAYLAHAGRRVLVVEARDALGGHLSAFTHSGYEFDIGLHYTSEALVQPVLRPLGVEVEFRDFDHDGMFRLHGPGRELAVPRGMEMFRSRLHGSFPGETGTVDTFLATAQTLVEELRTLPERPHLRELPQLPWRLRGLLRHATSTAGGYLDSLHASPSLKSALLSWTSGSMAVAPSRLSLPMAAMVVTNYLDGLSYPQGGSRAISEGLADVVRHHGGEILLGTEVDRILVDRGRVRGVQVRGASLDAGPEPLRDILAPAVVSAVDVKQTYLGLLPPDAVPSRLLHRVRGYEMALPLAVVYLVLDRDLANEGYPNSTYLVSGTEDLDHDYAALRSGGYPDTIGVGVWVANLADPHNARLCPPGQTNLQLMGPVPAQHSWWGIAPGSGPTERYRARRREVRDHMVRAAEHVVPGLSASIVHEEVATPVTSERFMRVTDGTSYGPAFTPRQTWTRLGAASPVEGLFHAGASVRPSHGVTGTLMGGVAAAAAVTGMPAAELQSSTPAAETVPG
ncbi:MAG TPA: NAD(P)/FAD-dependent oxidoreductase [Nocardioidaceae bacterium]